MQWGVCVAFPPDVIPGECDGAITSVIAKELGAFNRSGQSNNAANRLGWQWHRPFPIAAISRRLTVPNCLPARTVSACSGLADGAAIDRCRRP